MRPQDYFLQDISFLSDYQILGEYTATSTQFMARIINSDMLVQFHRCPLTTHSFNTFTSLYSLFEKGIILADNMFILEQNQLQFIYIIEAYLDQHPSQGFSTLQQHLSHDLSFHARKSLLEKCSALLNSVHAYGVVHGHLTTRQFIVDEESNVYLQPFPLLAPRTVTAYQRAYYSPQRLLTAEYDSKEDIWAFACVCLEIMEYASPVFMATSQQQQLSLINLYNFQGLDQAWGGVVEILKHCLQINAQERCMVRNMHQQKIHSFPENKTQEPIINQIYAGQTIKQQKVKQKIAIQSQNVKVEQQKQTQKLQQQQQNVKIKQQLQNKKVEQQHQNQRINSQKVIKMIAIQQQIIKIKQQQQNININEQQVIKKVELQNKRIQIPNIQEVNLLKQMKQIEQIFPKQIKCCNKQRRGQCKLKLTLLTITNKKEQLKITVFIDYKYQFHASNARLNKCITIIDSFSNFQSMLSIPIRIEVLDSQSRRGAARVNLATLILLDEGKRVWDQVLVGSYLVEGMEGVKIKISCTLQGKPEQQHQFTFKTEDQRTQSISVSNVSQKQIRQENHNNIATVQKQSELTNKLIQNPNCLADVTANLMNIQKHWREKII